MKILKISILAVAGLAMTSCVSMLLNTMVNEYDTNKDGAISRTEYYSNGKTKSGVIDSAKKEGLSVDEYLRKEFNKLDLNKDDKLTKEEMKEAFKNM